MGKRGRAKSLVVYQGLAKAVRRESAQAVARWWGVTAQTVTKWRKALGVPETNEGTSRLKQAHFAEPWAEETRRKAWAKARDPERREKIAASRRGKPRPPHVVEAVAAAHRGTHPSAETRRKMSESHRRRGTQPPKAGRPWTPEEEALLGTMPDREVSRRAGRTLLAVRSRRAVLEIPAHGSISAAGHSLRSHFALF